MTVESIAREIREQLKIINGLETQIVVAERALRNEDDQGSRIALEGAIKRLEMALGRSKTNLDKLSAKMLEHRSQGEYRRPTGGAISAPAMTEEERRRLAAANNQKPPPPTDFAPEQFWEHSAYMDAIGNLTMTDCTFGPKWDTKQITHYAQWDYWSGNYADKTMVNEEWGCWGLPTGLAHADLNLYGPVQKNIKFENCAWLAHKNPETNTPSTYRWGVRGFGMMDVVFDKCSFSRGMGAGTQVALRATAAHGNIKPSGIHRYERCTYAGIGDPQSERWGAFTISEHAPEDYGYNIADVEVQIIDCKLKGGHILWTDGNGKVVKSPRAIMANGRKRVEIRNLHLDYELPYSDWSIQIWDCNEVVIHDSFIREGRVELRNCDKVSFKNCTGNATLFVGTQNDKNALQSQNTEYSGPMSSDYSK